LSSFNLFKIKTSAHPRRDATITKYCLRRNAVKSDHRTHFQIKKKTKQNNKFPKNNSNEQKRKRKKTRPKIAHLYLVFQN